MKTQSKKRVREVGTLIGIAFLLHIVFLVILLPVLAESFHLPYSTGFVDDYDKLAMNVSDGFGYRFFRDTALTTTREPGYPLVLSLVFTLAGYSIIGAQFLNALIASASAALIAVLASRLTPQKIVVLGAPAIFLFHPGTLIAISRGGFEILFQFLLIVFILLLNEAIRTARPRAFILAGVALGCVVVTRSTLLFFPLFVLAYLWVTDRHARSVVGNAGRIVLMVSVMLAFLAPWIVRNYNLVDRFIPTTSVQGVAAHAGQYICKNLSFENTLQALDSEAAEQRDKIASDLGYAHRSGYYQYFFNTADEVAFSNALLVQVVREYADSPTLLVKCMSANVFNFWFAGKNWRATGMNILLQLPLLILSVVGVRCAVARRNAKTISPMVLLILYLMAVHIPIHAQARYSVPLIPFLGILVAYGISCLSQGQSRSGELVEVDK